MDCLVDTSVWVDFFNGNASPEVDTLKQLLLNGRVAIVPVIQMEILQGVRSDKSCQKVLKQLSCLADYPIDSERYIEAAMLYRQFRKKGLTIRKSIDCLIAAVAIHFQLPVLHRDRDFTHIVHHSDLVCLSPDRH